MTNVAPDSPAQNDDTREAPVPYPGDEPAPHISRPYRALERELERAVRDRAEINLRVTAAVNAMREGGSSWAVIARILGTAPQTAHKKYSKPRPPHAD
ncbi:hypothetical protein E3O25_06300 [Cryobacterium sp. TMT1-3]|uniref:hypothetical protein n=1 Tax=Cryobacterium sp. TMT1-3 TaxID=1259237 RepID=UPI001069ADE0|nr:hypothetical protein [Cryobacterium sp. TMT1-3]TFC28805.1 hypothetical protein E3O25_06300 [Cryobacterium sp. TMT1-3]